MSKNATLFILLLTIMIFSGCASVNRLSMPTYPTGGTEIDWDQDALSRHVNEFYAAATMDEAEKAVKDAVAIAPDAPATHEIEGMLERFRGNESDAWKHYYKALASPIDDTPYTHMLDMLNMSMTTTQYRESMALFRGIMARHPQHNMRRIAAAFVAGWQRRLNADPSAAEAALSMRGSLTKFAVISPFDNEDGKGFLQEYPPERDLDYSAEYEGVHLPARWRTDLPLDHQNGLDLSDLVSPGAWVTAYVNTYVKVPKEATYHLRVTTTDAIRMWVNDIEILQQQKVDEGSTDQFVVPLTLRKGWNRILVKSCHERGAWQIGLAVTDKNDALVKGIENTFEPHDPSIGPPPGEMYSFKKDVERRLGHVKEPLRKLYKAIALAESFGLTTQARDLCDAYVSIAPDGLFARYRQAMLNWRVGQRGGTIDVLDNLIKANGDKAPRLYLFRAAFFAEQGRFERVRRDLISAVSANENYRTARIRLAENYRNEGWKEDHLKAQQENFARWPDDTRILWGLAAAYNALGRRDEVEKIYKNILSLWKGAEDILHEFVKISLRKNKYSRAIRYQKRICEIYPNASSCYLDLGNLLRRTDRINEAEAAYRDALDIDDRWSVPLVKLGEMAYERGDEERALTLWKRGLEFDPDNHSLADRIEFIAPSDKRLLSEYIPKSDDINKVLKGAKDVEIFPGANLVYLLDHTVEQVELDGSSRQYITQVITAVNDTGRDQLTKYNFPAGVRLKVQEAYVMDPNGTRREASSLRGREVRFRELKVGSTIVLQYRLDARSAGYLKRYLYRRWFFHGLNSQFEDSRFDLILPKEMKIKEWGQGDWKRRETARGDRNVITYHGTHMPPLVGEPGSPPILNLLDQVVISSIPSWGTIADWDKALLVDVFRSTPQIKELAARLTAEAKTKKEKLLAITKFTMQEIRYQQDYENSIAGVRPHTASVVLQRGYGDCKDKSVLIMTLARELGIKTRFTILRTTGAGDFIKELPFLQFNHAIVYVPVQDGIKESFFLDATPDTLDLANLRPDDQGTWAMTIDPDSGDWKFEEIPLTPGEDQYSIRNTVIEPVFDAVDDEPLPEAKIKLRFSFQGPTAASMRQVLRNKDNTTVFAAQMASQLLPGAEVQDIGFDGSDDISRPLTMTMDITSDQIVRAQGDSFIVETPRSENLSRYTSLSERRVPLQTGFYLSHVESTDEVIIPKGYKVEHQPSDLALDNEFFTFSRRCTLEDDRVKIVLMFTEKVTRISTEKYKSFKGAVAKITDNLRQNLIFEPIVAKHAKKHRRKKK